MEKITHRCTLATSKSKKERNGKMQFKNLIAMYISTNCKRNKKEFVKPLKRILMQQGKMKSIVFITTEVEQELVIAGILKLVKIVHGSGAVENKYFQLLDDDGNETGIVLLKVKNHRFKIIPDGAIMEMLYDFAFSYYDYNGNVRTKYEGKTVTIEALIEAFTKKCEVAADGEIHHKWYRFSALPNMIMRMSEERHKEWHSIIGNYARNQVPVIESREEFDLLMKEVRRNNEILADREFSREF